MKVVWGNLVQLVNEVAWNGENAMKILNCNKIRIFIRHPPFQKAFYFVTMKIQSGTFENDNSVAFLTGVLLKMGANGPEGLTPINFKIVFYEVSLWYMNAFKIFWSPDIVFPKKMTNFCLDLAFSHENLRLSQKVFWGNSCCYIFKNTSNLIYQKSSIPSFS